MSAASTSTGTQPALMTGHTVVLHVTAGTRTSSPGASRKRALRRGFAVAAMSKRLALDPLFTMIAWRTPMYSANISSNRDTFSPIVTFCERSESSASIVSSTPKVAVFNGTRFAGFDRDPITRSRSLRIPFRNFRMSSIWARKVDFLRPLPGPIKKFPPPRPVVGIADAAGGGVEDHVGDQGQDCDRGSGRR